MIGLLASLFALSLLIFVHELGHFLAAKKAGVKVEEFGLGYPPRLLGIKRDQTIYSLNAIPFGGFVKIDEDTFAKKPKRRRGPVLLAGILMNTFLAIFLFSLIYFNLGIPQEQGYVEIIGVVEGSPAAQAGLKEGDLIRRFENNQVFIDFISDNLGQETELVFERGGEAFPVLVIPRQEPPEGEGPLGVAITDSKLIKPVLWQRPILSLWWGIKEAFSWASRIILGVGRMVYELLFKSIFPADIAGPIGIVQVASQVARRGIYALMQFVAVLSVNLAVLNLFPIPALDGGRLLFLAVETITGRKPKAKWEQRIHTLGMVLLLLLMLAITIQDLSRLFPVSLEPLFK